MRILVTGGAGFIGARLVRAAVAQGHHVINVDALTYAASLSAVWDLDEMPNYTLVPADVTDGAAMRRVLSDHHPDAIMHLAAESHVDRSIKDAGPFVQTNVVGTFTLLEAVCAYWMDQGQPADFRFHQISTDEVFGALGEDGVFTDQSKYAPNSPYAATKASADHLVRAWHATYGLPTLISYGSNTYGPGQYPEKLIPLALTRAVAGEQIPVYGNGQQVRDWLFVDDHARGLLSVLERGRVGEAYAIGGGTELRNIDLVRALCRQLQVKRPIAGRYTDLITHVPDRPGHDFRYAMDTTRAARELEWCAETRFEDGLAETIDWHLRGVPRPEMTEHNHAVPLGDVA
ncbi:dTDP-glucose 4,6-dehydratase [Shimia ponticola]|uniref:dTDP-glucose 4,6-dehydratase n=1 Tax=Shimia ponticola TaxID=2582893 RepID=UPI0011BE9F17|nr:dTDP-glucose 4,6-dehydratase [Shimia ponticola]